MRSEFLSTVRATMAKMGANCAKMYPEEFHPEYCSYIVSKIPAKSGAKNAHSTGFARGLLKFAVDNKEAQNYQLPLFHSRILIKVSKT